MRRFEMRRRVFLGGLMLAVASSGRSTAAAPVVGKAAQIRGNVRRRQGEDEERLAIGGAVLDKDYVVTSSDSFADLALSETRILLGPQTELLIDSFIAGQGGTLELGVGRMVFDRPEGLPKTDVAVRTAFGMPNLVPPVVTSADAAAYRERIRAAIPEGDRFDPLMTLYLTEGTDPGDVEAGFRSGLVKAVKLYPAGATTNSSSGVRDIDKAMPVLERMALMSLACVLALGEALLMTERLVLYAAAWIILAGSLLTCGNIRFSPVMSSRTFALPISARSAKCVLSCLFWRMPAGRRYPCQAMLCKTSGMHRSVETSTFSGRLFVA